MQFQEGTVDNDRVYKKKKPAPIKEDVVKIPTEKPAEVDYYLLNF